MANKNFKGRPKGSNKVIITDPSLGKYYISQDEWSFNLIRKNANRGPQAPDDYQLRVL